MTLEEFEKDEFKKLPVPISKLLDPNDIMTHLIKRIAFTRWEAQQNTYEDDIYQLKYEKKRKPGPKERPG